MQALISLLFGAFALLNQAVAQSPRVAIVEMFASASSGTSGTQARRIDSLIDTANAATSVLLIYHTAPPQPLDTLGKQTQAQVTTRKSYYNPSNSLSAPAVFVCGENPKKGQNVSNPNNPLYLNQAKLDSFLNLESNYTLQLIYRLSTDKDSIFVQCKVVCTKNFAGTPILRMMLMEEEILFANPIGSDAKQKKFYNVFRSHLGDNAFDVSLKTLGGNKTFEYAGPLPSYIYNKEQIRVIAFVQESATKKINQSVIARKPAKLDSKVATTFASTQICNPNNFTLPFTILNNGELPIASLNVSYQLDNQAPVAINTGISLTSLLMAGASKSLNTPSVNLTAGEHTIRVVATKPNTLLDDTLANDTIVRTFLVLSAQAPLPMAENFAATQAIPAGFFIRDVDNDGVTWRYDISGVYAGGSALSPCFEMPVGTVDELFLPKASLVAGSPYFLTFDRAHAQYSFPTGAVSSDMLEVKVSSDCGLSWAKVWGKSGSTLATVAPLTVEFIPATTQQWQYDAVDLSSYAGSDLLIKFVSTSDYGNHIYLDNIKIINSPTSVAPGTGLSAVVAPVPTNGPLAIQLSLENAANVSWHIADLAGKQVLSAPQTWLGAGAQTLNADLSSLSNGVYLLQLSANGQTVTQKIVVAH